MNEITTVGVDLAKEVIVVCAGDAAGRAVFFRQFSFAGFAEWAANLPPWLMGLEACSSAHHGARFLTQHGHTPRLMAAELVEPLSAEPSRQERPQRCAGDPVRSAPAEHALRHHQIDRSAGDARLASGRRVLEDARRCSIVRAACWPIRSLGSAAVLRRQLPHLAEDERLPARFRPILTHVIEHLQQIDARIDECDVPIREHTRHSEHAQRLQAVLGIGNITASALLATIANPRDFRNGRQLSAWCGLVPRQHSSGGKARLGVITKRGDAYLRGLLTQGARSTLQAARKREPLRRSRLEHWIVALHDRVGYHKTLVAIANKHLRTVWAILAHDEHYDPNAWRRHPRAA